MAKLNSTLVDRIKDKLRSVKKSPYVLLVINTKNRIYGWLIKRLYSDEEYVRRLYGKGFKKELDLENPQTFNEKLQWLKLNYRDPVMAICADKYRVRDYVFSKGFGDILNTLIEVYEAPEDIDFDALPERFVLKASHGCGWNIVCENKSTFSWAGWRSVMESWMKQNLYIYGREWVYNELKPRIVCEKYLETDSGELFDYKFFCLNGKVEFIQVTDNDKKTARINLYDKDWKLMEEKYAFISSPKIIPRPEKFEQMMIIAEALSKPFPFARIDLYDVNGEVIFGEITFFPSSGFKGFEPKEFDLELGLKLLLPDKNN